MKRKMSNEPASKTARASMAKAKNDEPFKASADMNRIIPLAGGEWAYVQDPRDGKLHHLRVGSDAWDVIIDELRIHPEHAGRIQTELKSLGW